MSSHCPILFLFNRKQISFIMIKNSPENTKCFQTAMKCATNGNHIIALDRIMVMLWSFFQYST